MEHLRYFMSERVEGLSAAFALMGVIVRFDTRSQSPQICTRSGDWIEINDQLESRLRETIASHFFFKRWSAKGTDKPRAVPADWSHAKWRQVMDAHLADHRVDSFIEWLERLPRWDGRERLESWLEACGFEFADAQENAGLIEWSARSILLTACSRALSPGVKQDTIPVLIGPQGVGKSTALAWLLPEDQRNQWFTDGLRLSADEKRRVEALQGPVIVEVAEMSGATTADIDSLKAFISRTNDHVRLSYRRNPESHPRLCSIVGTANGTSVLPNDTSGNRRFVALQIKRGSASEVRSYLDENRDQLWAEAWERAQDGEVTHLPHWLRERQESVNEIHRSGDMILEEAVLKWLKMRKDDSRLNPYFRLAECAEGCGILRDDERAENLSQPQVRRLARTVQRFGCQQTRVRISGKQMRVWALPDRFEIFHGDGP